MKILDRDGLKGLGIKWSRQHIDRKENDPDPAKRFPRHVNIGDNTIGWIEDEVIAYLKARVAERNATPAREPKDPTPMSDKARERRRVRDVERRRVQRQARIDAELTELARASPD